MKKQYFVYPLKLAALRLAFLLITVFIMPYITWLLEIKNGFLYYSIALTVFLSGQVLNRSYYEASKDLRQKTGTYPLKGMVLALPGEIPTIVFLVWLILSKNTTVPNIVYSAWNSTFAGFLSPGGDIFNTPSLNIFYYLVPLFLPVVSGIGYFLGLKNYAPIKDKYINKLIYKDKDKNDKNN